VVIETTQGSVEGGNDMISIPVFKPGEFLTVQKVVERSDTGANIGTGKLDQLLASPTLLHLMIEASTRLIDARLPDGIVSVGTSYTINHEQPTLVGETVTCKVTVLKQEDSKITLAMETYDEVGLVCTGGCERYIANQDVMVEKAKLRIEKLRTSINV
jgi:predicted thioesterase